MQKMVFEKTALVMEGGGFRGIFTAGVLDVLLQQQLIFDYAIGVSAGATYGVSYVTQQPGRNLEVNRFIGDKRYAGIRNLLFKRSYFSWDFIFDTLPATRVYLDWEKLKTSETRFWVGVTNCETGKGEYYLLNPTDQPEFKTLLAASCSLPFVAPVVKLYQQKYMDGGLADSIPFEKAFTDGINKAVVIVTRPKGYVKEPLTKKWIFKWRYRKYPKLVEQILSRPEEYNRTIERLELLEQQGKVFVIRPEAEISVGRLENNPAKTEKVYYEGIRTAENILPQLREWLMK